MSNNPSKMSINVSIRTFYEDSKRRPSLPYFGNKCKILPLSIHLQSVTTKEAPCWSCRYLLGLNVSFVSVEVVVVFLPKEIMINH